MAGDSKAVDQALRAAIAKSIALKTAPPRDSNNRVAEGEDGIDKLKNVFNWTEVSREDPEAPNIVSTS